MALSDVILAATLNNQAELYKEEGRYADAEPLYKRVRCVVLRGGEFISMVVKSNPERVAPAAIRNEETPTSRARGNPGDGKWAIRSKRWRLVTISANASNAPRTAPIAVWTIT
jgi:hypothetical protein